jgi:MFS superfamily sulfate permease-like transporter
MTAIRMVAMEHLKHMFHHDKTMFWISILSAATCIVMDTMAGIIVGGIVSLLLFTDQMSVGNLYMSLLW